METEQQQVEAAIRSEFRGASNAGLRKLLRETYAASGTVRGIAGRVALSYGGKNSLDAVEKVIREFAHRRMADSDRFDEIGELTPDATLDERYSH